MVFEKISTSSKHLVFPPSMDADATDLCRKLLNASPQLRLGSRQRGPAEILEHPFFAKLNFDALTRKSVPAPYVPPCADPFDLKNFDVYDESTLRTRCFVLYSM
jgi:hypothetical protein